MASETTALLIDARDQVRRVPSAWPVPALRPYQIRWCATCASENCGWPGHPILTFRASTPTHEGWAYRSAEAWPTASAERRLLATVITASGDACGTVTGTAPWPSVLMWQGRLCDLWCTDVRRAVVYRVRD